MADIKSWYENAALKVATAALNTEVEINGETTTIESALKKIEEMIPHWIPCAEKLPENHSVVLTCSYGSDVIIPQEGETLEDAVKRTRRELVTVSIGFIGSDGWYGADGWPNMVAPTFWMPLPDPPEAGADDA